MPDSWPGTVANFPVPSPRNNKPRPASNRGVSGFVGRIGSYSYSIYLLHFFVVFQAARFVSEYVMNISNFYLACLWSFGCFLLMMPIGYLSFRFIEAPFLAFRKRYTLPAPAA